jgi:hypothetical protein
MKKTLLLIPISVLGILACEGSKVTSPIEPTDEDAIYNIIRYDRPLEFNIDLYDFSIPDTSVFLAGPFSLLFFWREIEQDSLFIDIDVRNPVDTAGAVLWAPVHVIKYFWGSLELIAEDTSSGGSQPVRLSKPFIMIGEMNAIFEKVGFDNNTRRGWIMSRISDVIYRSGTTNLITSPDAITQVEIESESHPRATVDPNIRAIRDIPTFSLEESLTVYIHVNRSDDHVLIRHVAGAGYIIREPARLDSLTYMAGFRLPRYLEFNHFLIDIINGPALSDTLKYQPGGQGVLYRVR